MTESAAPVIGPISLIHRAADSVVVFQCQRSGWPVVACDTLGSIESTFPEMRSLLGFDSFFGINGRSVSWLRRRCAGKAGGAADLGYLQAVFLDLDVGRAGSALDFHAAASRIHELAALGVLPSPSVIQNSGRGCWTFWLLRDGADARSVVRATTDARESYSRIRRALCAVALDFPELQVDTGSSNPARVTRVPGSVNTKSGTAVSYYVAHGSAGDVLTYTVSELSAFLGVETRGHHRRLVRRLSPALPPQRRPSAGGAPMPAKANGSTARWRKPLDAMDLLREVRGGFRVGHRNRAALYYARCLRCLTTSHLDALSIVAELSAQCRSRDGRERAPLTETEIRKAVGEAYRRFGRMRHETVALDLGVTFEEMALLDAAGLALRSPVGRGPSVTASRRQLVRELCDASDVVLSGAAVLESLGRLGVHVSLATVSRDRSALGVATRMRGACPSGQGALPLVPAGLNTVGGSSAVGHGLRP